MTYIRKIRAFLFKEPLAEEIDKIVLKPEAIPGLLD